MKFITNFFVWPLLVFQFVVLVICNTHNDFNLPIYTDPPNLNQSFGIRRYEDVFPYLAIVSSNIIVFAFLSRMMNKPLQKFSSFLPAFKELLQPLCSSDHKVKEVTFYDLVIKTVVVNLEIITILVLYWLCNYTVNVLNGVLLVIFLLQMSFPDFIKRIITFILSLLLFCLISLLFLK